MEGQGIMRNVDCIAAALGAEEGTQDSGMMSFVSKPPFGCCVEHGLRRIKN